MGKEKIIRDYLSGELNYEEDKNNILLKDDDNLLKTGLLDSLGILKLISFLEEQFNMRVMNEDITADNFCSIDAIFAYLEKQKSLQ